MRACSEDLATPQLGRFAWKNLRRRTRTARRVDGGLLVGRVDRSFTGLCLLALSDKEIATTSRRTVAKHEAHLIPGTDDPPTNILHHIFSNGSVYLTT